MHQARAALGALKIILALLQSQTSPFSVQLTMNPSLVLCRLPRRFILPRVTNWWLLFEGGIWTEHELRGGVPVCVHKIP